MLTLGKCYFKWLRHRFDQVENCELSMVPSFAAVTLQFFPPRSLFPLLPIQSRRLLLRLRWSDRQKPILFSLLPRLFRPLPVVRALGMSSKCDVLKQFQVMDPSQLVTDNSTKHIITHYHLLLIVHTLAPPSADIICTDPLSSCPSVREALLSTGKKTGK